MAVHNKAQLLQAYNEWARVAKNDIRRHLNGFSQKTGFSPAQIAQALNENPQVIADILRGIDVNIPMSLFAKILIASDHCIAIMSLQAAQEQGQMRSIPNRQNCEPSNLNEINRGRQFEPNNEPVYNGGTHTYHPETDEFIPNGHNSPFRENSNQPLTPPYPMPQGDYMLPDPELIREMARRDAFNDLEANRNNHIDDDMEENIDDIDDDLYDSEDEINVLDDDLMGASDIPSPCTYDDWFNRTEENRPENSNPREDLVNRDDIQRLAEALRNNPEITNLLRNIL